MICTVVLSTYNGEKYVEEQLTSLVKQKRKPDEVLIFDDCSTDKTLELIKVFIEQNKLCNWKVYVNSQNQGWKKNFWNAIECARGDVIFLCDQDDVWRDDKIQKMMNIMENNSNIELLVSGYIPTYEDEITQKISTKILNEFKETTSLNKIKLDSRWMFVTKPGCTFALTSTLYEAAKEIWDDRFAHDATLWRMALLRETAYFYDENLILWRRYSSSSSNPLNKLEKNGSKIKWLYNDRLDTINSHILFIKNTINYLEKYEKHDIEKLVQENLNFRRECKKAFETYSIIKLIRTSIKYRMFYYSYKTMLIDWAVVLLAKLDKSF